MADSAGARNTEAERPAAEVERELRAVRKRLSALVDGTRDGVFMVDPSGCFVFVNDFIAESSGYPKEAFVGRHFLELIRPEDRERVMENFERVLAGEKTPPYELAYHTASGEEMWVEISTTRVDGDGEIDGVLSISRNIQVRKRMELALRESEAKYRALIEGLPHAVAIVQDGRLVFANRSAEKLIGADRIGEVIHALAADWQRARLEDMHGRRLAGDPGLPRQYRTTVRNPDGEETPVEVHLQPIQYGGRSAWQCVGIDLSDWQKLEAQLHHSQKMEAVGTMAGGIAHDFNNLLTGITGTAELLRRLSPTDPEVGRCAEIIERAAGRAADLTRQLLGFARKTDLVRVPVDLEDVAAEVCDILAHTLPKNIRIRRATPEAPCATLGDATQLGQVLMNLALNARDAMPDGGDLGFEVDSVTVDDEALLQSFGITSGRYCRVTVSDTGVGIPPEIVARIFDPFFTTKPVGEGSGMGLAVAYGIVRSHHGAILVEGCRGEGTRISVLLPPALDVCAATDIAAPRRCIAPEASNPSQGRGLVLLVDDEPLLRETTTRLLETLGYAVLACPNGPAALEELRAHAGDIVAALVDVSMPGMDGWACLAAMREIAPSLPAVMTSGRPADPERQRRGDGAVFLAKPYSGDELASALGSVL